MTESGDNPGAEKDESELDLSSLLNKDTFGPDWVQDIPGDVRMG